MRTAARVLLAPDAVASTSEPVPGTVSRSPDTADEASSASAPAGSEADARYPARRFALLLMAGSSVIALTILAGVWFLLRHLL